MSDIEGKAGREAVSECGQRANFNCARAAWLVTPLTSCRAVAPRRKMATAEGLRRFETRSLPALSRSYPRHYCQSGSDLPSSLCIAIPSHFSSRRPAFEKEQWRSRERADMDGKPARVSEWGRANH